MDFFIETVTVMVLLCSPTVYKIHNANYNTIMTVKALLYKLLGDGMKPHIPDITLFSLNNSFCYPYYLFFTMNTFKTSSVFLKFL